MSVGRYADLDTLLLGFEEAPITVPSSARGLDIPVGRRLHGLTMVLYPTITPYTIPTAPKRARPSVARHGSSICCGRRHADSAGRHQHRAKQQLPKKGAFAASSSCSHEPRR